MPRGAKKNANQHNSRHENGVVAPGKRIVKQRSNSNLNGSADARPVPSSPPPTTSASARALSPVSQPPKTRVGSSASPAAAAAATAAAAAAAAAASAHARNGLARGQKEESTEEPHSPEAGGAGDVADTMLESQPRRPDYVSAGSRAYPSISSLPAPLTVLVSCPLRDALAVLIMLLSLPPVIVTVTNSLFAVMTFVPPSGSFTLVPTLTDITSSFSPGTPSFLVTCLIDILAMTLWIWIPFTSLQAFFLDAAQAMVATSLGGGFSYRPGSTDNTLYCVSIVVATHIARYRAIFLKPIRHRVEKWGPWIGEFDDKCIDQYPVGYERNWFATIKVFIALHIFCQGMTAMVRRRLHTPRQSVGSVAVARAAEVDNAHAYATGADASANAPHSPTELRPKQSFPNLREVNRDKISSGKRRRKQANFVRSQQPFWAALASTKISFMREYDTKRATTDALSSKATNAENLGNAPFLEAENVVFATEVKETAFFFETGPFLDPRSYVERRTTRRVPRTKESTGRSRCMCGATRPTGCQ